MASLMEVFAKNLKKYRKKTGLSQGKLAEKVAVSTHHIAMIELARNFPTPGLIERLADNLDIRIYELFIEDEFPYEELRQIQQDIRNDVKEVLDEYFKYKAPLAAAQKGSKKA